MKSHIGQRRYKNKRNYRIIQELLRLPFAHLYQFDNHIEMNPGGLYGQARPENFPHVNDYRNGVVAVMMRVLNYVNMFNHGIGEVRDLLHANENPEAEFNVGYLTAFSVIVRNPGDEEFSLTAHQLAKEEKI